MTKTRYILQAKYGKIWQEEYFYNNKNVAVKGLKSYRERFMLTVKKARLIKETFSSKILKY